MHVVSIKLWWEEIISLVRQGPSISRLQTVLANQFLHCFMIIVTENLKLFASEVVYKSMGQLPELSYDEGDVGREEAEESPSVIFVHTPHQTLDALLRDLCHTHILQIKYTCPALDLTGQHRVTDDIVEKEVSHGNQSVQLNASVKHSPHVDEKDRVHLRVAFVPIEDSQLEVVLEWGSVRDYKLLLPFRMLNDLIVSSLVVPLQPLQEAKENTVCVIIARGQFQVSVFEPVPEIGHVRLFAFSQLLPLEQLPLVISGWKNDEHIVQFGLKCSYLVIHDTLWN